MNLDALPSRLDYLRPVIEHLADSEQSDSYEDADSLMEEVIRQRIGGLSTSDAKSVLKADRRAVGDWIAHSTSEESPGHYIFGWMMMGVAPLLGDEDTIETLSEMISAIPAAPPGREFGPVPSIEPTSSDLLRDDGNLFLYISSESSDPKQVDICVSVNGEVVVHDVFEQDPMSKWTRYRLALSSGEHTIVAASQSADVSIQETFVIRDELHASIRFWYSRPSAFGAEHGPCFTFHAKKRAWVPEHGWKLPT